MAEDTNRKNISEDISKSYMSGGISKGSMPTDISESNMAEDTNRNNISEDISKSYMSGGISKGSMPGDTSEKSNQSPLPWGGEGGGCHGCPGAGFLSELFSTFFHIGLFTLGGGYAMIPLIEEEVVNRHKWVAKEEMLDLIAIAQSCPGVFAINISIFVGYKLRRLRGAVAAALGTALPSFLIILAIAIFFKQFEDNKVVAAIFRGIRPAVVALIAVPTFRLGLRARLNRYTIWIPVVSALAIWLLGVSPIYIILIAGIAGYAYGKVRPHSLPREGEPG